MVPEPFPTVQKSPVLPGPELARNAASTPSARWQHVEKYAALVIAAPLIVVCTLILAYFRLEEFFRE